jgi:hypothetical protein
MKFLKRLFNVFTVLSLFYLLGFFYILLVDRELELSVIGGFGGILVFVGVLNYLTQGKFVIWNRDIS